jgi:hypothetical protein
MSDRDTHFQGFAKLLWDELVRANEYGYIDVNTDDDPTDPTDYLTLIARRAYDLLFFLIDQAPTDYSSFRAGYGTPSEIRETIEQLPDMTEFPPTE